MPAPSSMHIVQCHQVSKRYGRRWVLQDISFSVQEGETFGIVGLNGAGKSTLLRLLLGFAAPSAGSVLLQGIPPSDARARRGVGYLPEVLQLPSHLTPWEIVSGLQQISGNHASPEAYLRMVLLPEEQWHRPTRILSKGQRQRVGLAQALATGMRLLVLDEPATGLDARGREDFLRIAEQVRERGVTLIFTSHLLDDVERVCERLLVLHEGRMLFFGDLSSFVSRYEAPNLRDAFFAAVSA